MCVQSIAHDSRKEDCRHACCVPRNKFHSTTIRLYGRSPRHSNVAFPTQRYIYIYIYCDTNICIFTYLLLQRVRIFVGVDLAPRNENENRYAHDRNKSQQPKLSSGTDRLHLHSFPHTGYVLSSSSPIRINLNKKPPRV